MLPFPLDAVTLHAGPFRRAVEVDLDYVLALDVDRLLAPFRREAGLPAVATPYGNWESGGLDGHVLGHYLGAAAALAVATGDGEIRRRLEYAVAELARCQDAGGDGYVGGIPDGRALWAAVRVGIASVSSFGLGERWVPWYNLHKTFAGLIDAWRIAGIEQAGDVVRRLADWWLPIGAALDDGAFERMLAAEFGGMAEVFADLAELTGRADLLAMGHRFADHRLLDPLLAGRDELTGLHANTQIPKAVGYARLGAVGDEPSLLSAARHFWDVVAGHRSVAIGGNSTREHFHPADDFSSHVEEREGPETCNTWNMVRLARALLAVDDDAHHLDVVERMIVNHLLSAQHPERGGFVYFTPMRPAHYRVYSQPQECFWCCVGSGIEAQARYGELVFGRWPADPGAAGGSDVETISVNLFVPATLDDPARGVRLTVDTRFPVEDRVSIRMDAAPSVPLRLLVRRPDWLAGSPEWALDGTPVEPDAVERGWARFEQVWSPGEVLSARLPMTTTAERLGDGSDWVAFRHGPVVLAARNGTDGLDGLVADDGRMGHVAAGPLRPLAATPLVGHTGDPATMVRRAAGDELRFVLTTDDGEVALEPFAGIHDERYTVYWPDTTEPDRARRRAALVAQDERILALDDRTIDVVTVGEQQPEADHALVAEASTIGSWHGRRHREATGWFAYRLADRSGEGVVLRVACRAMAEDRTVRIEVDGEVVADALTIRADDGVIESEHPVAPPATGAAGGPGYREVSFHAVGAAPTPPVLLVRLLRA